jgi:hypothetical protein
MSSWTPTTYKTQNWAEYNFSLKQRGSLSIWFDPEMTLEAAPSGRRGRQQTYSDAAIQACLTLKVLFSLPLQADDRFCGEPAKACWVGLVSAGLQLPVSQSKNIFSWVARVFAEVY